MVWGFCVYFVYMIPLETDVLRKHRFQKSHTCMFYCSGNLWTLISKIIVNARQDIIAAICDFQQCGILTSVDSDKSVQPTFKLRNS